MLGQAGLPPTHAPPTHPPTCQAKSEGDGQLVSHLEADAKVAGFQRSIACQLRQRITQRDAAATTSAAAAGGDEVVEFERHLAALEAGLLSVSELYNDFAQPLRVSVRSAAAAAAQ